MKIKKLNEMAAKNWTSKWIDNKNVDDDDYIDIYTYFVNTYENGQYKQLKDLFVDFVKNDDVDELIHFIDDIYHSDDRCKIKNFILKNIKKVSF